MLKIIKTQNARNFGTTILLHVQVREMQETLGLPFYDLLIKM